jgi:hypothetical protein
VYTCLAIKGKYPDAGGSVPGIENMTFAEVLKATRPGTGAQHDFMAKKNMVPTMQKFLKMRSVTSSNHNK